MIGDGKKSDTKTFYLCKKQPLFFNIHTKLVILIYNRSFIRIFSSQIYIIFLLNNLKINEIKIIIDYHNVALICG
jgi:hypothetical protein